MERERLVTIVKERERQREREGQTDRQTDRDRNRETDTDTDRHRQTDSPKTEKESPAVSNADFVCLCRERCSREHAFACKCFLSSVQFTPQ